MSLQDALSEGQPAFIETQLLKFSITDSAIAELSEKYFPLVISDVSDKSQYQKIQAARREVKVYRVDVDKKRKELTVDALAYQRAINSRAKEISDKLSDIEEHLKGQEEIYEAERERVRLEAENAKQRQFDIRLSTIIALGFTYNQYSYRCAYDDTEFNNNILNKVSDESFNEHIERLTKLHEEYKIKEAEKIKRELEAQEEKRQREEDAKRQAEQERLLAIEERKEANRLAEEKLAQERNALAAERKKLEEEKEITSNKTLAEFANLPKAQPVSIPDFANPPSTHITQLNPEIIKMTSNSERTPQEIFLEDKKKISSYLFNIGLIELPKVQGKEAIGIMFDAKTAIENTFSKVRQQLSKIEANLCQAN